MTEPEQNPGPSAAVVPTLYLNVTVNGQTTVYDVASAELLLKELSVALKGLKPPAVKTGPRRRAHKKKGK